MRLLIFGSTYLDTIGKIKDVLFSIKRKINSGVVICGHGKNIGADPTIKKIALEFGFEFEEYIPICYKRSTFSVTNNYGSNMKNKSSSKRKRNEQISTEIDKAIYFHAHIDDYDSIELIDMLKLNKKTIKYIK